MMEEFSQQIQNLESKIQEKRNELTSLIQNTRHLET